MPQNKKKSPLEITIETYDRTASEYAKNVADLFPKGMPKFSRYLKPGAYILDHGCGSGKDAKIFTEKGYNVLGVDLSKEMIKIAKKTSPKSKFKLMDIRDLKFKPKTFDGIWSVASLVHIPKVDMNNTLKDCYKVLKEKGVMYVSVKHGIGEEVKPDERYGGLQKSWSFFQQDEIKELLQYCGFNIIEYLSEVKDDSYATNPWIDIICRK